MYKKQVYLPILLVIVLFSEVPVTNEQHTFNPTYRMLIPGDVPLFLIPAFSNFICGKTAICNRTTARHKCAIPGFACQECSCDKTCYAYGTCCFDMYFEEEKIPTERIRAKCVSAEFKNSIFIDKLNYTMISSCPHDKVTDDDHNLCLDPDTDNIMQNVPVQGIVSGQEFTFKNRHCARCNGLDDSQLSEWIKEYKCIGVVDYSDVRTEDDYHKLVRESDVCAILFKPTDAAAVSTCGRDIGNASVVSTCRDGSSDRITRLCDSLHHVVAFEDENGTTWYQNEFCVLCNGVDTSRPSYGDSCLPQGRSVLGTAPLSVIFDFNRERRERVTTQTDVVECEPDRVYDSFNKYCRRVYCPPAMLISNHSCRELVPSAHGVGYRLMYNVVPNKAVKIPTNQFDKFIFVAQYLENVNDVTRYMQLAYSYHKIRYSFTREGAFVKLNNLTVYMKLVPNAQYPREPVEQTLRDIQTENNYWYMNNRPQNFQNSTRFPSAIDDADDDPTKNWTSTTEIDNTEVIVREFGDVHNRFVLIPSVYYVSDRYFRVVNDLLSCSMVLLNETEYTEIANDAILFHASNTIFRPGQYRKKNRDIYICSRFRGSYVVKTNITKEEIVSSPIDYEETILTIVCTALSLIGLAITLITYACSPLLRTFPGKNNMALFATMFVAQLLFITTIRADVSKAACSALGAVTHYFYLTMFFWKNVCAFHMYCVFCRPLTYMNQTKWLTLYSLYSFLSPHLIIGVYILANLATSDWSLIGYGGKFCFLSSPLGIGLGFALPVALILVANAVFFFSVIRALSKSEKKVANATTRENIGHNAVYFKMSLLLGFTWAVGFLAAGTGLRVFWYLFSFLNSIIGMFICITYVFKRDVLSRLWVRLSSTSSRFTDTTNASQASSNFGKTTPTNANGHNKAARDTTAASEDTKL